MDLLYEAPDHRLTMGQRGLNVTSTNVSKVVAGLGRKGLVRRVGGKDDRRVVHSELTELGGARFRSVMPRALRHIETFWKGVESPEKAMVIDLLRRVWFGAQGGPVRRGC